MNVGEFKQLLEDQKIPDDHQLTIRFIGGMGSSTVGVKSAYRGFDWTAKQLVCEPALALVIEEWFRNLKKGVGHDASFIGRLVQAAEQVIEESNAPGVDCSRKALDSAIADLEQSLSQLAKFQKQGF